MKPKPKQSDEAIDAGKSTAHLAADALAQLRHCLNSGMDVHLTRGMLAALLAEREFLDNRVRELQPPDTTICIECGADSKHRVAADARAAAMQIVLHAMEERLARAEALACNNGRVEMLLRIKDAAKVLNVTSARVTRMISDELLQSVRIGDRLLVPRADVERLLARGPVAFDMTEAVLAAIKGDG